MAEFLALSAKWRPDLLMKRAAARQHKRELSAERMRRTRERHGLATWVLRVDVDNLFGDTLIAAGRLHHDDESDKSKIAKAASVLLREWMESVRRGGVEVARNVTPSGKMPSSENEHRPVESSPRSRRRVA